MNNKVKSFLRAEKKWQKEMELLREIIMEADVVEDFKWMHPCYTNNGKNIVLIHGFKDYCALLFHKGVLLEDPENILVQQTVNSQIARQIRVKTVEEIKKIKVHIKNYIKEAIEIEKAGKKVVLKELSEYSIPKELNFKFKADPIFKKAFYNLTPGRQKSYLLHFSEPKQSKTRESRIIKSLPKIYQGLGLNER